MALQLSKPVKISVMEGLPVFLTFKKVKNINIRFKPDRIAVSAPPKTKRREILELLEKNKESYIKKIEKVKKIHQEKEAARKQSISESKYLLLFGEYLPIVYKNVERVKLTPKKLIIPNSLKGISQLLLNQVDELIYDKLFDYICKRLRYYERILKVKCNHFSIRKMETRWGSCTPSTGTIRFNFYLAFLPKDIIDSVIVHELCHLKEANHQAGFYDLLYEAFPDYDKANEYLKKQYLPINYIGNFL